MIGYRPLGYALPIVSHRRFRSMVVSEAELSLSESVRLQYHLDACPDCRRFADLCAENREHLRGLARLRPPTEVRESVLAAADRSGELASTYGPLLLPFLIVPTTLVIVGVVLVYGVIGLAGDVVGMAVYSGLTVWHVERHGGMREMPEHLEPVPLFEGLARSVVVDMLGVLAGGTCFLLLCLLLVALKDHLGI